MGFCCQGLENPLLMEWEKAEKDSEREGGEDGISHWWVRVNGYKDNALCLCVWAWVHVRAKWAETNGAVPEDLQWNIITSSYAFGTRDTHTTACTWTQQSYTHLIWFSDFNFGHRLILLCLVCHDLFCQQNIVYYARIVCFHSLSLPLFSWDDFWTLFVDQRIHAKQWQVRQGEPWQLNVRWCTWLYISDFVF